MNPASLDLVPAMRGQPNTFQRLGAGTIVCDVLRDGDGFSAHRWRVATAAESAAIQSADVLSNQPALLFGYDQDVFMRKQYRNVR